MRKVSKKIISCFMLCALMMSSIMGFAITSNAASVNSSKKTDGTHVYYVSNESSLRKALNCVRNGDCIEFTNNIVSSGTLYVSKNITVDLNYHSLRFEYTLYGLYIQVNSKATVKNGVIYGADNSRCAVEVSGNLKLQNMSVFGGNHKSGCSDWGAYGNGIYVEYAFSKVYMNYCYIQGGNGYKKSSSNDNQSGKAIYTNGYRGDKIISEGMGYTAVDGICQ